MNFNIVSSLSVDLKVEDQQVFHPIMGSRTSPAKKRIYWKAAYNFFLSSTINNPGQKHILYTNDEEEYSYRGFQFKNEIKKLGVEVRYLPFSKYYIPGDLSKRFKNAYYKFEVISALQYEPLPSIIMDLDCLWIKPIENLDKLLMDNDLLLYDTYDRSDTPLKKHPHNISMKDMGDVFKKLNSAYPVDYPVWYGGEFLGARPEIFKIISKSIEETFDKVLDQATNNIEYSLPDGNTLLNGDEYISSYVFNMSDLKIFIVNKYLRRVWTAKQHNDVNDKDLHLAIWHLIAEKSFGLDLFFNDIKNELVNIETTGIENMGLRLGKYFGIPRKPIEVKAKHFFRHNYRKVVDRVSDKLVKK